MAACSNYNKKDLIQMAHMAEYNDMFGIMASIMRRIIEHDLELSSSDRLLFYCAYSNLLIMRSDDLKKATSNDHNLHIVQTKADLEKKRTILRDACSEALALINTLMEHVECVEAKAFYLIMKGDVLQWLIAGTVEEEQKYVEEDIGNTYEEASTITKSEMLPTNPYRLEIALKTSEYYFGICESPKKAYELLQQTLSEVDAEPEQYVGEYAYKAPGIIQLIKEKLELWTSHT